MAHTLPRPPVQPSNAHHPTAGHRPLTMSVHTQPTNAVPNAFSQARSSQRLPSHATWDQPSKETDAKLGGFRRHPVLLPNGPRSPLNCVISYTPCRTPPDLFGAHSRATIVNGPWRTYLDGASASTPKATFTHLCRTFLYRHAFRPLLCRHLPTAVRQG